MLCAVLLFVFSFLDLAFGQSTTPFIQDVFVGKCYQRNPSGVNCTALWDAFSLAATMSNYVVTDGDYALFFSQSDFTTPRNGILFWSGNQAFALAISNANSAQFTTVEGTSTGYMLNGLSWCGELNSTTPQFDYTDQCAYPSNNTYYGTEGVWGQCSRHFAQGASGRITVLLQPAQLNYNSGPYIAYRNTSVFSQIELPNINASNVDGVTILLLANDTLAPGEKCGNGSLLDLSNEMKSKFGYAPDCEDDPEKIYKILCPDDSTSTPECLAATLAYSRIECSPSKEGMYFVWALVATTVAAALLVLTSYFAIRSRHGYVSVPDTY